MPAGAEFPKLLRSEETCKSRFCEYFAGVNTKFPRKGKTSYIWINGFFNFTFHSFEQWSQWCQVLDY